MKKHGREVAAQRESVQSSENLSLLTIVLTVVLIFILNLNTGCTPKKKNDVSSVSSEEYVQKTDVVSNNWNFTKTFMQADVAGDDAGVVPGFHADLGFVQFVVTKDQLVVRKVGERNRNPETATIVASFPITKHFDIVRKKNDYGEETNQIIEDETKPWNDRAFMRVDWGTNLVSTTSISGLTFNPTLTEEGVKITSGLKKESGYLNFDAEAMITQREEIKFGAEDSDIQLAQFRAKVKNSFIKVAASDYIPYEMPNKDFARFGYFRTYDSVVNPDRGEVVSGLKRYANRFNVCEISKQTAGKSCQTRKIAYTLNEGFPEEYRAGARLAVAHWNNAFKVALDRQDDVVVLDESVQPEIGDTRFSMIAAVEESVPTGLLGVSQTVNNPQTGETLSARSSIYMGTVRLLGGIANEYLDQLINESIEANSNEVSRKEVVAQGEAPAIKKMLNFRTPLKLDKIKAVDKSLGKFNLRPEAKILARNQASLSQATARRENIFKVRPDLGIADLAWDEHRSVQTHGAPTLKEISLMSKNQRNSKMRDLRLAERGIESSDVVEPAVEQYILKFVARHQGSDLAALREQLKAEVRQMVFVTTLLHEMGHNFGLRHNFAGSGDKKNYSQPYYDIETQIQNLAKSTDPQKNEKIAALRLDQQSFDFSSIMDYTGEFHQSQGGLGPYDLAAIRFAYNGGIDRTTDPIAGTAKGYKFCTDHQVGEDLLCRRFDRGSNVTLQMANLTDDYHRRYLMRAFRRDRLNFGNPNSYLGTVLMNVMLPARQVHDEFLYQLITSNSVSASDTQCENDFFRKSVDAGEMANICDSAIIKKYVDAGVDPSDWSQFIRFLMKPDGSAFLKNPTVYASSGAADLIFAGALSSQLFTDVLGAPEPGSYFIQDDSVGGYQLVSLPNSGGTDLQRLAAFFISQGLDPISATAQAQLNKGKITKLTPGVQSKYLMSRAIDDGSFKRVENLGYIYDKIAALIIMGARDLSVQKYSDLSLRLNMYFAPQTQKLSSSLYSALMTENKSITTQTVLGADGKSYDALVPASLNQDIQLYSMIFGVSDFVSEVDRSFLSKVRICEEGDHGCQSLDRPVAVMRTSDQQNVLKAVQTDSEDSIAFAMVSQGAEVTKDWEQAIGDMQHRAERAKELAAMVAGNGSSEKSLEALAKNLIDYLKSDLSEGYEQLAPIFLASSAPKGEQSKLSLIELVIVHALSLETLDPQVVLNDRTALIKALGSVNELYAKVAKANPSAAVKFKAVLQPALQAMLDVHQFTYRVALAEPLKAQAQENLSTVEKNVLLLKEIVAAFSI